MNHIENLISNLKKHSFEDAALLGINIYNEKGVACGRLVPVGHWILNDTEKIEMMMNWRKNAMRMFFAQFETSFDSTLNYLKKFSVDLKDRLLFLIFDENEKFIGHIGFSNLKDCSAELDNLMRGVGGGDPRIIYNAELALMHWCFENLKIKKMFAKVISYNWLAIDLHKEIGFSIKKKESLKKINSNGFVEHQVVEVAEANVAYTAVTMEFDFEKIKIDINNFGRVF